MFIIATHVQAGMAPQRSTAAAAAGCPVTRAAAWHASSTSSQPACTDFCTTNKTCRSAAGAIDGGLEAADIRGTFTAAAAA